MTPEQFAYWLKGIAETSDGPPTKKQWQIITDHLATVFTKVTPVRTAEARPLRDMEVDIRRAALRQDRSSSRRRDDILIC